MIESKNAITLQFVPGMQDLTFKKPTNVTYHISRLDKKNDMIISTDAEKIFDRIQHPFRIQTLSNLGMNGTFS